MTAGLDRVPGESTRLRRVIDNIGGIFVPYVGAIKNVDLGSQDLTTTGLITAGDVLITSPVNIYLLSHDSFADFVANEHIDHTSVVLTAGVGISGGGDISANRTFDLDILGLTTDTIAAGDWVPFHDLTDASNKITFANLEGTLDHGNLAGLDTGADHSFIDQSVISGSSPTFDGTNFTGIPNGALDETYVNADGTVDLSSDWTVSTNSITLTGGTLTAASLNATDETDALQIDGTTVFAAPVGSCLAIGAGAMGAVGVNSVVIGKDANATASACDQLVAVGEFAAKGASSSAVADDCVYIGYSSGGSINGVGPFNTCVGAYSGRNITTGSYNNCYGRRAGQAITTGAANALMGESAGIAITEATHNMCLGQAAGNDLTTGSHNTLIGQNAGDVLITGGYNVLIGSLAAATAGGGNIWSSIALGANIELTANNQCIIGGDDVQALNTHVTQFYLGTGVTHASAASRDITVQASGGSGTNNGGADFTLAGGKGTGNAASGEVLFQTSTAGSSGTALQTLATRTKVHGTGLVLPKASGNGIQIEIATPTFGWRDLLGDVFARNTGGTKPTFTTYRDTLLDYQFAAGDEEYFKFHIPHDYAAGTDIHLHIHWSHTGALVNGGTVTFEYEMSYAKGWNQAAFPASVSGTIAGTASTTQYQQIISEGQVSAGTPAGSQIDSDDLEPDGIIIMRAGLQANNITVSSGGIPDPFIHYMDIHYQSTGISTKNRSPDFYA